MLPQPIQWILRKILKSYSKFMSIVSELILMGNQVELIENKLKNLH